MDNLQILRFTTIVTLFIALVSGGVLAWLNPGSRNLGLATGALAGAIFLFLLQLSFELRTSDSQDVLRVLFTIDRQKPEIRQWAYRDKALWRGAIELGASEWLAANNPLLFQENREKVTADLALFSLLAYLTSAHHDWQMKKVTFGTASTSVTTFTHLSKPNECTTMTEGDLQSEFSKARNVFANAPLHPRGTICLPPKSTLTISDRNLIIQNPFCRVSFTLESYGAVIAGRPDGQGELPERYPHLPNGEPRFETRLTGIRVQVSYFGLRVQHRDAIKYRQWISALMEGLRVWFEG